MKKCLICCSLINNNKFCTYKSYHIECYSDKEIQCSADEIAGNQSVNDEIYNEIDDTQSNDDISDKQSDSDEEWLVIIHSSTTYAMLLYLGLFSFSFFKQFKILFHL